jgi:hypothetical protein
LYGVPTLPYGTPTVPEEPTLPLPITIPSVRPVPLPEPAPDERLPLFKFRPDLMLSEDYSDNFNFTQTNQVTNFRTTLAPGGLLFINDPTIKGSVTGSLPITYDSSLDDVRLFYSLAGEVQWQATPRLRLTVFDTFVKNDSPTYADSLGLQVQRNVYYSNIFALEALYQLVNLDLRASYQLVTFFNEDPAFGDTTTNTIGLSAATKLYQLTTLALGYQYLTSDTSGDFAPTDTQGNQVTTSVERKLSDLASVGVSGGYSFYESTTGGVPDNFDIWTVSAFALYTLPNILSLRATAGFSELRSDRQGTRSGFSGGLDLLYRLGLAQLSVSANQGFSPTFGYGQNFGVVETRGVAASVFYPFTADVSGTVSAYYRENIGTGVGTTLAGFTDRTWATQVGLSVRLLRWLNLDASYT